MKEKEPDKRDVMMGICRLTYMLVNELVKDVDKREEYLELIDEAVEQLKDKENTAGDNYVDG